ncbi:MAG: OmpA family protein [Gammaproteobacteria bacterium]|nr:OmpA family protein [Gammaproteobacteria bacterium]
MGDMKRVLLNSSLLVLTIIWPAATVVSEPPRSWNRMSTEMEIKKAEVSEKEKQEALEGSIVEADATKLESMQVAKLGELQRRLEASRVARKKSDKDQRKDTGIAKAESETKPAQQSEQKPTQKSADKKTNKQAESLIQMREENSADDGVVVEWVGKDRRLKRVKKVPGGTHQRLFKPPNKLIVTDEYHQSVPELLTTGELRRYGARPTESSWVTKSSKFLCEIRHPIPRFGYAVFKRGVGQRMQFALESYTTTGGIGQARIQSVPPIWKHYASAKDLGVVPIESTDNTLFTVSTDWAGRLMLELEEGMQPSISFWDEYTGGEDVVLSLSPFNFKQALPEFNKCMGNLLPYSYKDVRQTTVYFGYDKSGVAESSHERLRKIVEYVKLDETVKYVDVIGYSDSRGFQRYNELLATKRANAVKKFLLAEGLDKKKVRVRAKGEKGKKHSNRTEAGRRKNRRVEITMVRK